MTLRQILCGIRTGHKVRDKLDRAWAYPHGLYRCPLCSRTYKVMTQVSGRSPVPDERMFMLTPPPPPLPPPRISC